MSDKKDRLFEIISQTLGIEKKLIKVDSKFVEDLDADSLDIAELVLNIEESFGIKIADEEVGGFKTVGDVIKYLN